MLVIELVLACLLVSLGGQGQDKELSEFVRKQLEQIAKEYNRDDQTDRANWLMDFFHRELKCCGVNGPTDWATTNGTKFIPSSCCFNESTPALKLNDQCEIGKFAPEVGCVKQVMDISREHIFLIGSCALVLALVEMIAISVAYCLSCAIRSRDQ